MAGVKKTDFKTGAKFVLRKEEYVHSSRGQASVTDALILLAVVSALSSFLFVFAINYGSSITNQVTRNDSFEFVSSALKTIMYQSVPRDADVPINLSNPSPDQEVDYLMATVKEDYADDQVLTENTKKNLARSVYQVMRPVADNHDYLFTINTAQEYVLMILWKTNFIVETDPTTGEPLRFQNAVVDKTQPHKMYYCKPPVTSQAVDKLFLRVGSTTQAHALVNMLKFTENSFLLSVDVTEVRADVLLSTWVATAIPAVEQALLNCTEIDTTGIISPVAP